MGLVFFLTFNVIGLFFQNLMEMGIDALTGVVDTALTNWNEMCIRDRFPPLAAVVVVAAHQ